MKTTLYISRHSESIKKLIGESNSKDKEQIRNEKTPLSVNGEMRAKLLSEYNELKDIDVIYSSDYVRAISTAKYIAEKNNLMLNIDYRFGERRFGVKRNNKLPIDFTLNQFRDWEYKLNGGESLNEVHKRMNEAINELLVKYKNKKIVVVAHGTSLSVMLSTWCTVKLNEDTKLVEIYFNNKLLFNGKFGNPELFKLEFEENNLVSIINIKEWS